MDRTFFTARGRGAALLTTAVLASVAAAPVHAEGWFWQTSLGTSLEQNSNVRLSVADKVDAAGMGLTASGALSVETPDTQVSLRPGIAARTFSSDENLDSVNLSLDAAAARTFERARLGADLKLDRDTTLTTEFEDSGNLRNKVYRNLVNLKPYVVYKLTPISGIRASLGVTRANYDDGEIVGYYDYDRQSAELSYELDITQLSQLSLGGYVSNYASDYLDNESTQVGINASLSHKFAETTALTLSLGSYDLSTELSVAGVTISSDDRGALYRLALNHKAVLTTFTAGLSQQLEPSSIGEVRRVDRVDAGVSRELTERLSASFNAMVLRNEASSGAADNDDRDYRSLNAGMRWKLDPLWSLSGSYRYAYQQYDAASDAAQSHSVMFSILFNSLKKTL